MSWKSIRFSIYSLVAMGLFAFAVPFLFSIETILGIIGIVVFIVVPVILRQKAIAEASGVFDKIFAKYILLVLYVIIIFFEVMFIFGMPW